MGSKKIESIKKDGCTLKACYGHPDDNYVAKVYYYDPRYGAGGTYIIRFYYDSAIPEFTHEEFPTTEMVEARMRELQPDLRKWRKEHNL